MVLVLSPNLCRLSLGSLRMVFFFNIFIDELLNWQWAPRSQTRNKEKPYTYNRYLSFIFGELYQHTSEQDVQKQRSSSLASRSICVDCLAIGRQDNQCRRPKHSLWLNKRYSENRNISTQQRYRGFHQRNTSLSTVVQLSHPVKLIGSRALGSLII